MILVSVTLEQNGVKTILATRGGNVINRNETPSKNSGFANSNTDEKHIINFIILW